MDNILDYQSRARKIDPPLLRSSDETLNQDPSYDLFGGTLNPNSPTHFRGSSFLMLKVSNSQIDEEVVGVRGPLYLGHS